MRNDYFFRLLVLILVLSGRVLPAQNPTLTAVSPTPNSHNVPRYSPVGVTFDQSLAPGSAAALKVFSNQRGGLRSQGGTPATVNGNQLQFTPSNYDFKAGERVDVTVTTAVTATGGGTLATPKIFQFVTATGGLGQGNFRPGPNVSVSGSFPNHPVLGDLDGDGDLDLITAQLSTISNRSVTVSFNDGTGAFSGSTDIVVGDFITDVVLGDIDSDGDLDFLTTNGYEPINSVSIRLNDGTGTFTEAPSLALGTNLWSLTLGDIDGDGDLDLLAMASEAFGNATVFVRFNDGTGTFSGSDSYITSSATSDVAFARDITLCDVDKDGDLDFLMPRQAYNAVFVYFNNVSGVFSPGSPVSVGNDPQSIATGDWDGDGDVDLATADRLSNSISIRINDGQGVFGGATALPVGEQPNTVVTGDIDADGDLDLLCSNSNSRNVSVYLNDGSGTFTRPAFNPSPGSPGEGIVLGDLDGDLDLDFISTRPVSVRFNEMVPVALTNPAINSGVSQQPFNQSFTASGGNAPYTFSLIGGTLPTGLTLASTGVLSGTPTQTGSFTLTVQVTDKNSFSALASSPYVLRVVPAVSGSFDGFIYGADCATFRGWAWDRNKPNNPVIIDILDGVTVVATLSADVFRQDLLSAEKGNGRHAFFWPIPDALKEGLPHSLSARITGNPFVLKDSPKALICTPNYEPEYNQSPQPPVPTVLIAPLVAQVGVPFSGTLVAFTDPEGTELTYSLSGLPDGLSLSMPGRVISGTPTVAGSFVLTYQATDDDGASNSVSFVLTVNSGGATTVSGDFEGYLDKLDCGGIRGWIWDRKKPNTPLTVEFYLDGSGTVLGSAVANIYRQDLKDANKGNGAHAYNFTPPGSVVNGTLIRARVLGSTYDLKGSPKAYQCTQARMSAETGSSIQVAVLGNPVSNQVAVEIRGAEGQPLRLQLTDASGRLISQRLIEVAKPFEHQTLLVPQQPAGLLFLQVSSGSKTVTLKVLKQ
ncbi:FG-GAP-like repeat-containing protein [Larkinella rosea]|uniref:T9SS C-terminal target domain-containing protein n=1 Tax=Larkinella rosea TaxID=2025312 RepID=A0A3P1C0T9_9BACT|nr:FG-GAP-like repeat-containing protein [Larkinella rosea]RRB06404.1 T9SS C-terminal target domain-containing protein [Larkinella rosea]